MRQEQQNSTTGRPRLKIQGDLPIRTVGIETQRERKHYTYLPPQNYLHVWWARRPTPASRLGILASVLPNSVDDDTLLRWMQIDPSNLKSGVGIADHVRNKEVTVDDREGSVYEHYGYRKIWTSTPDEDTLNDIHDMVRGQWDGDLPTILDATAGGGSIPFESVRYGFPTIANELNPVASVILKAVLQHPRIDGNLSQDIKKWGEEIQSRASKQLAEFFPASDEGRKPANYIWANTINCPDCGLELPLSHNWWIDRDENIAVKPVVDGSEVIFEIIDVSNASNTEFNPSTGTVSHGKGDCLNCHVTIDGDEVKRQAQEGETGFQLFCVEYLTEYDNQRGNFRTPNEDDNEAIEKASRYVENEIELSTLLDIDRYIGPADRSANYGIVKWRDMYTPRQLLTHYIYWRKFEEIKEEIIDAYSKDESEVILTFLAFAADKALDYNNRLSSWDSTRPKIRNTFERHDFAFKWSFAESNLTVEGLGYDWILGNVITAYEDLYELSHDSTAPVEVYQENAADLPIDDESVQAIVIDPPYYDNVMYSELSDFFYVWLRKYLGDIYPDFFESELTPKADEAVADSSKFDGVSSQEKSKSDLAKEDYERKMTDIFRELHRVLDTRGVFTLMFTHKKTEAWDTLTTALIESGFIVTSTHPISTESQLSLHQAGKNSAESTILLASEKRLERDEQQTLWSEIRQKTRQVAREKARQLDEKEIDFAKVDIILASFGPTLEVFTRNYPVIDDEGNEVRPQTALDEARTAVRDYLIDKYLNQGVRDVDPITEWYVLAWLVFEAQRFPYDEANRLGKGVGIEVDDIKSSQRLWRKKGNDVVLRQHDERVQTPADKEKSRTTKPIDPDAIVFDTDLDKVHATMYVYDSLGVIETEKYIKNRGFDTDASFRATYEALLRVLPPTLDDWEILRDMALTDVGKLLDLDIDKETFQRAEDEGLSQDKLSNYD